MKEYGSILKYHNALLHGTHTCVDAVKFFLAQIDKNAHLNCFLETFADEAMARAQQLDQQRLAGAPMGKMHGVIVGIKDVFCYQGHTLTGASKILENFTAIYNATIVARLLQEEAIIIGRQNCDEFAMGSTNEYSAYGAVLNAADNTRVPGGSSGGSAVAIQANLCMVSLGSDTGGSVRQPADFCGILGLKPTYGLVSRYGMLPYASTFDTIGIFAHNIADMALTLEVMAGEDECDSTSFPEPSPAFTALLQEESKPKFKIAYLKETIENEILDPEIRSKFLDQVIKLKNAGHEVSMIDQSLLANSIPTYYVLTTAEAARHLARFGGVKYARNPPVADNADSDVYERARSHGFGKEVQRRILLGNLVQSPPYFEVLYIKAQQVRNKIRYQLENIFKEYDFMISPTVSEPAFKLGEKKTDPAKLFLDDYYTAFANLGGLPAISLPLYTHSNGMPFGLQIISSAKNDAELLKLSQSLMSQNNCIY